MREPIVADPAHGIEYAKTVWQRGFVICYLWGSPSINIVRCIGAPMHAATCADQAFPAQSSSSMRPTPTCLYLQGSDW
ncbi:hypothetical protein SNOG_06078 [Parastagonospora nodorum SN15]|uniref:Uncharacterized protein n=1 Tax=Phaeosphaeria nodorum (strain SN15 / ATCC MYA-4574 / FGSC 10173) TaxID=321614 RepID=Q0UQ86_PHANO|nr:hypothetical protein SNOG_06078 [Parastagonospora nodorum SN15]EAT87142.1 hypothetical protein SNOG_06078 [Parastagonospora nodorum SN15]